MIFHIVVRDLVFLVVSVIAHRHAAFVELFMEVAFPMTGIRRIVLFHTEVFYYVVPVDDIFKIGQ